MVGVSKEWSLRADSDLLSALCVCSGEPFAVREFVLFFAILILLHRMFLDFFSPNLSFDGGLRFVSLCK